MESIVKVIVTTIAVLLGVVALVVIAVGLSALAAAIPALLIWAAWGLSGAHYFDFDPSFVQVWAGVVVLNVARNLLIHGAVPKEAVQSATKKLKR